MEHRSGRGHAPQGEPQDELGAVELLRAELRALPELEAPDDLWPAIEDRLVASGVAHAPPFRRARRQRIWPASRAVRVAGMAAVFVIGLGLGRLTLPGGAADEAGAEPAALTVAEALEDVRRYSAEYDAALRRLEMVAENTGTSIPSPARERLAALDLLVEASRTALAAEPADPELNAYLFAALEQRDNVMREIGEAGGAASNSEVVWR